MGGERRARRRARAREFGRRHPRLTLILICAPLAGVVLLCVEQLVHGGYLGRGWGVAALAGIAAAVALGAAALIASRRHSPVADRLTLVAVMAGLASVTAFRIPFPRGSYGSVQAALNMVHAALLGYEVVATTAVLALLGYLAACPHGRSLGGGVRPVPAPRRAVLAARLRFPEAETAPWRAGHVTARNDTVTWRSLKGDVEVDLTPACQALPVWPADAHGRQPRTTTLATASGPAELDVTPRALAELIRRSAPSAPGQRGRR